MTTPTRKQLKRRLLHLWITRRTCMFADKPEPRDLAARIARAQHDLDTFERHAR